MTTFQDLVEHNPNIRQRNGQWREQRSQNGEDTTDYQTFRQHLNAQGPGEQHRDDLVGDDFKPAAPGAVLMWACDGR